MRSKHDLLEEALLVLQEVSYDVLFAGIVFAHPVWVCLLTLFMFDSFPG